jgi:hypothetical protein
MDRGMDARSMNRAARGAGEETSKARSVAAKARQSHRHFKFFFGKERDPALVNHRSRRERLNKNRFFDFNRRIMVQVPGGRPSEIGRSLLDNRREHRERRRINKQRPWPFSAFSAASAVNQYKVLTN